jgi:dipeptidyl aminopeptidase/acylaminoacyl peptidase
VLDYRENARNPSWAADGRVIFEHAGQVILAGAIDRVMASGRGPQWHPDSRFFAYASGGRIVFLNPDTGRVLDSFQAGNAIDLRFSRDGTKLAWLDSGIVWIRGGGVSSVFRFPPGLAITGVDDFSLDGRELLVTAAREIHACSIARPECRQITRKPRQRQDFARLSPSGRQLLFTSSETAWVADAPIDYEADLWIQPLNAPGSAKRMTWFNEPANPRYDPATARVNSACWSPDGLWVLATITEGPRQDHSRIVKIQFPEAE